MGYDEKSAADVETASPNNILTPLLLLLAARRGVHHDSNVSHVAVPDGYALTYRGKSGVTSINHSPLSARIFCGFGHLPKGHLLSFLMTTFFLTESILKVAYGDKQSKAYRWRSAVALAVAAVELVFFIFTRIYAKRHAAAATPPHCDPDSYQYRLSAAMAKADVQYTEIVSASLAEMEKLWTSEQHLVERFRIEGLVDPEDRRLVYDVVLRFYKSGNIMIQFPSAEKVPANTSGILIEEVAAEKS